MSKITQKQLVWLNNHGGRSIKDVRQDQKGLFVFMNDRRGEDKKIYIPKDSELELGSYNGYDFVRTKE